MSNWKRLLTIGIMLGLVGGAFLVYKIFLPPSLHNGEFDRAVVDVGKVIKSVTAEGTVSPENEVFILSPASSIIKYIHVEPGSHVRRGEVILVLDPEPIEEEIEGITDQLGMKQNNLQKTRLNARNTKIDLDYNVEVKKLKIVSLKSQLEDEKQLLEVGGISPAKYEKTEQELVLAEKDLEMIQEKNSIRLQQLETEEEGLQIQIVIQQKELNAKQELLNKMIVRAPSDGIILAVEAKEGEKVNQDRLLLTLSDLTTYKITCRIGEEHSDHVKTGGKVYALINDEKLPGQVGRISPMITDDKVEFNVYLQQSSHEQLKPNLHLELMVVTSEQDSVLRIARGPVFERGTRHEVFVIKSGTAYRQEVQTGLKGRDYVVIKSGLAEGDRVIISDVVASFRRINELEIRKK